MNTLVILKREHTYDLSYFGDVGYPKRFSSTSLKVEHLNKKLSSLFKKYKIDRIISDHFINGVESESAIVFSVEAKLKEVYHAPFVNAVLHDILMLNPQYNTAVRVSSGAKPDNTLRRSQIMISLIDNQLPIIPEHIKKVVSINVPLNFDAVANAIFELSVYNIPAFCWIMQRGIDLCEYHFHRDIEEVYQSILNYFGSESRALSVLYYWVGTGYSVNEFLKYTEIIVKNANYGFISSNLDDIVLPSEVNSDFPEFIVTYMREVLQYNTSITLGKPISEQVSIDTKNIMSLCIKLEGCDSTPDAQTPPLFNLNDFTEDRIDQHEKVKKY